MSREAWALLCGSLLLLAGPALGADRGADGEFETRASPHFVLHQDVDIDQSGGFRGSRRFEQGVLQVLEQAYQSLDALLGLRPRRKIEVVVYDAGAFDRQFGGFFRFPAAGFYAGVIRVRSASWVEEPLVRVLHHELVHAALDQEAGSAPLPGWLHEGLAEWFEARTAGQRDLAPWQEAALVEASRAGRLPWLAELAAPSFAGLGPEGARLAYLESYAFLAFLARSHGERSLERLATQIADGRDLARGFRRAFGADLDRLEERFRARLR
jgi:hypothetical protein